MQILRKTSGRALKKARLLGELGVIEIVKQKGLTGRGGANFPTGKKWEFAWNTPADKKYVICNADEGEPGTFKDKLILQKNPGAVIEGILIASYAIGADKAYIYLRGEYDYLEKELQKKIDELVRKTNSKTTIEIVVGGGAYICGEETAILSSIEGHRGIARDKPPYPAQCGLFGKPTVINNVETLANVALSFVYSDWNKDLYLFSLSGNVTNPGVFELPLGTSLRDLIALGRPLNKIKAVYFGCSGGCLPNSDIALTPKEVASKGCMLGTCTVIAVDEHQSIVEIARNIAKFYEFESCGKCTPCREGSMRVLSLLENMLDGKAEKGDLEILQEIGEVIRESSSCGLGQTATNHLLTGLYAFRREFEEKII